MSSETALKALMQERMVKLYTYWQHWKKQKQWTYCSLPDNQERRELLFQVG